MNILVTGAAGFVGMHFSKRMLESGWEIIGFDNMNAYYDVNLKHSRLKILSEYRNFKFIEGCLTNYDELVNIANENCIDYIVHLAAQAGVRYSIENPRAYVDSNLIGIMNILELARKFQVKHLIYASSSSVYGGNKVSPFSTNHSVDHPVSLYAATKKSNELLAHSYSHLYNIPTTGLRFFTVFGPMGRPDMAYYSFTKNIIDGKPIKVFNHGKMERDFTYIDDIVEGIVRLIDKPPVAKPDWDEEKDSTSESFAPYKIYNIGNNQPVTLMRFIEALENAIGKKAEKIYIDMQPGDVVRTYADVSDLERDIDFKPQTSIEDGLQKFVDWYKEYYNITI